MDKIEYAGWVIDGSYVGDYRYYVLFITYCDINKSTGAAVIRNSPFRSDTSGESIGYLLVLQH